MPVELAIFLLGLLPVALRGWIGWRTGATLEMRHTLTYLFALLAALRYWRPATEAVLGLVSLDRQFVAVAVFLALFVVAALVAGLAVNLKGEFYQSVAPNVFDNLLGAVCGVVSGALIGGVLVMLCAFVLPGKVEGFDAAKFPGRFDLLPEWVFRTGETEIAGIAPASPSATQFPLPVKPVVVEALVKDTSVPPPDVPPAKSTPKYAKLWYEKALMKARGNATIQLAPDSAFRLDQLAQAQETAQAEKKLLGFIMVWDVFFGNPAKPQGNKGEDALAHFHEVFRDNLVLVYVRHEELDKQIDKIPQAVKKGFFGSEGGKFSPNMAVVSADAQEFVCQIPLGGGDATDGRTREAVFREKIQAINAWIDAQASK